MRAYFKTKVSKEFLNDPGTEKALAEVFKDALLKLIKDTDAMKIKPLFEVNISEIEEKGFEDCLEIWASVSLENPRFIQESEEYKTNSKTAEGWEIH
jgi:hypothetical protein